MNEKIIDAILLMMQNSRMHKRLADTCVEAVGIDRTRHIILLHIMKEGILPSQKKLAEHLNITPSAITISLKKMENDGYIKRKNAVDNRFHEVSLTDKGIKLLENTRALFDKMDERIFAGFTSEELDAYIAVSEKINLNLKNQLESEKKYG